MGGKNVYLLYKHLVQNHRLNIFHPAFNVGNRRVSRLLTALLLYWNSYEVGKIL